LTSRATVSFSRRAVLYGVIMYRANDPPVLL
jgi:hypothetical protein